MGVAFLISEILLLSKTVNFSFPAMDIKNGHQKIGPWSSKNLIDRNRLKKFKLVGIDVNCMHINFGGHSLSGFRDNATFKNGQFSLSDNLLIDTIYDLLDRSVYVRIRGGVQARAQLFARVWTPPVYEAARVQSHAWVGLLEVSVAQCACAEVS